MWRTWTLLVVTFALHLGRLDAVPQGPSGAGQVVVVEAILEGTACLPCDVTPPVANDTFKLVIWFKDETKPVYSYDLRGKFLHPHWTGPHFGERAHFLPGDSAPAALCLKNVSDRDEGSYRCRVDFTLSPSKTTRVQLIVVVPPDTPIIHEEQGLRLGVTAGPYEEGSSATLTCIVHGGRPKPTVRWWRGERLLEGRQVETDRDVRAQLVLATLTRDDLHSRLTCQAANTQVAPPVSAVVRLDLYLRPLTARILSTDQVLSAGRQCSFICQSAGSRPAANISWWLDGVLVNTSTQQVSEDGNVTDSTLTMTPSKEDNDRVLTCRAENQRLSAAVEEDSWKLNVNYVPVVVMKFGKNLNPDDIEEGDDVYFECIIKANPSAYKVVWKLNSQPLAHSTRGGVILSNQHLALRRVDRRRYAGNYSCVASNVEGDGQSNILQLSIMFKPVCRSPPGQLIAAPIHELAAVTCNVDAHPPADNFRWAFNGSLGDEDGGIREVPETRYKSRTSGFQSTLTYTPIADGDYGLLLCWASNTAGRQEEPCVFHVVPAGKPDPPSNCSLVNQTSRSLQLDCVEGFDGGQSQQFELLVYDALTGTPLSNMTSLWPSFSVAGLSAGQMLHLVVYATNSRGRSPSVVVDAFTLKAAEMRTATQSSFEMTPVLGALMGLVFVLLLLAVLSAVCAIYVRARNRREVTLATKDKQKDQARIVDKDDKNPDVVPYSNADGTTEASSVQTPGHVSQTSPTTEQAETPSQQQPAAKNGDVFHNFNNTIPWKTTAGSPGAEVTYAELSLPRPADGNPSRVRHPVPTVYAQIDHTIKFSSTPQPPPPPPREVVTVRTPLMVSQQESCV